MKLVVTLKPTSLSAPNITSIGQLPTLATSLQGLNYKFIAAENVDAFVESAVRAGNVAHVFDYNDTFAAHTTVQSVKAA